MARCAICKEKVETTFLQKPIGTYIRNAKGKKFLVCNNCQKSYTSGELREKL